jgi:Ni2+-binding GTPase involved in maturation of urease and hydrogenase
MKYITVQGAPGAGKTTTMKTFMEYLKNKISPTIFRYEDMSTKKLAEIVSHQSIEVWITNDNKLAILGRYQSNLKKPELCGADSYTAPQKTRLKAIIQELKLRGIELVISEGFGLTNKPYLEQLDKTFEEIDCVILDVNKGVCFERFKKRNIQMWKRVGNKKRIKEFINKEEPEWKGSRGEKKLV